MNDKTPVGRSVRCANLMLTSQTFNTLQQANSRAQKHKVNLLTRSSPVVGGLTQAYTIVQCHQSSYFSVLAYFFWTKRNRSLRIKARVQPLPLSSPAPAPRSPVRMNALESFEVAWQSVKLSLVFLPTILCCLVLP